MDTLFIEFFSSYGYRFWIILFAHLKCWKLVYNYFSASMGSTYWYFQILIRVSLYICSHIEKSEHFVIKIRPQLVYRLNPLHWTLVLWLPTYESLIHVAPKLWCKKHRNSCKHSPLSWFVKWWIGNVLWVSDKHWCLIFFIYILISK